MSAFPQGLNTVHSPQGLNTLDNPEAVGRLKYMLLCKIMTSKMDAEEVPAIIASRAGLKYAGGLSAFPVFPHSSMASRDFCMPGNMCSKFTPLDELNSSCSVLFLSQVSVQFVLSICQFAFTLQIFLSTTSMPSAGEEVDSMAAVAKAYAERSLQGFQAALDAHREQLAGDPVVHTHLQVRPLHESGCKGRACAAFVAPPRAPGAQ